MARDVGASCQPNVVAGRDVLEEAAQGGRAARSPDDAAVEPDGHHPPTLAPKLIEGVDQILGELPRKIQLRMKIRLVVGRDGEDPVFG